LHEGLAIALPECRWSTIAHKQPDSAQTRLPSPEARKLSLRASATNVETLSLFTPLSGAMPRADRMQGMAIRLLHERLKNQKGTAQAA
jgi:hypothetical protein